MEMLKLITQMKIFYLSEKIIYDQLNNFINSTEKTTLKDNFKNIYCR